MTTAEFKFSETWGNCHFIVRHQNGAYWVSLPGIDEIELASGYDDRYPAVADLSASGHVLDEVKREVQKGLERWLPLADPEWLAKRAETEKDGAIVANVKNQFLVPTAFSSVK